MVASYKEGGLKLKYDIRHADGREVDPEAQYFVLRIDKDPNALVALSAYMQSVAFDNPQFASDLEDWHSECWSKLGPKEQSENVHREQIILANRKCD